jgi:hypothetical protein
LPRPRQAGRVTIWTSDDTDGAEAGALEAEAEAEAELEGIGATSTGGNSVACGDSSKTSSARLAWHGSIAAAEEAKTLVNGCTELFLERCPARIVRPQGRQKR